MERKCARRPRDRMACAQKNPGHKTARHKIFLATKHQKRPRKISWLQKLFCSERSQTRKKNPSPQNVPFVFCFERKTVCGASSLSSWSKVINASKQNPNLESEPQRKTKTQQRAWFSCPRCCSWCGAQLTEATTPCNSCHLIPTGTSS